MYTEYSNTQTDKTTQYNTTQDLRHLFPKKKLHSGVIRTHASRILRMTLYQLSYQGSYAGHVYITHTNQA